MKKPPQSTTEHVASLLDQEIKRLTHAHAILTGSNGTRPQRPQRVMSKSARDAISRAQKRRWRMRKSQLKRSA